MELLGIRSSLSPGSKLNNFFGGDISITKQICKQGCTKSMSINIIILDVRMGSENKQIVIKVTPFIAAPPFRTLQEELENIKTPYICTQQNGYIYENEIYRALTGESHMVSWYGRFGVVGDVIIAPVFDDKFEKLFNKNKSAIMNLIPHDNVFCSITEYDEKYVPLGDIVGRPNWRAPVTNLLISNDNMIVLKENIIKYIEHLYTTKNFVHWDLHYGNILISYSGDTNIVPTDFKIYDFDRSEIKGRFERPIFENFVFKTQITATLNDIKVQYSMISTTNFDNHFVGHCYDIGRILNVDGIFTEIYDIYIRVCEIYISRLIRAAGNEKVCRDLYWYYIEAFNGLYYILKKDSMQLDEILQSAKISAKDIKGIVDGMYKMPIVETSDDYEPTQPMSNNENSFRENKRARIK